MVQVPDVNSTKLYFSSLKNASNKLQRLSLVSLVLLSNSLCRKDLQRRNGRAYLASSSRKKSFITLIPDVINQRPGVNVIKLSFVRDLWIFVLNQSVCLTRLENLTNDKHSSLLQKYVICIRKKCYNIGSRVRRILI